MGQQRWKVPSNHASRSLPDIRADLLRECLVLQDMRDINSVLGNSDVLLCNHYDASGMHVGGGAPNRYEYLSRRGVAAQSAM